MSKTYLIRAHVQPAVHAPQTRKVDVEGPRLRVELGGARDAAGLRDLPVQGDQLVRVELANGFVYWSRADDLLAERGRPSNPRSGEATTWEITPLPASDVVPASKLAADAGLAGASRGERGLAGLAISALEFFGVDLKGQAARELGKLLESRQLGGAPGLVQVDLLAPAAAAFGGQPVGAALPAAQPGQPWLVFLHGTASSSAGSFGGLWPKDGAPPDNHLLRRLYAVYGERAFAFQHRSLTVSPIANALELARALPHGAQLHLVSHSRGGLVGELLCLGQRERGQGQDPLRDSRAIETAFAADRTAAAELRGPLPPQAEAGRADGYQADRELLAQLLRELDDKQFDVHRFVRVACPARGTTLASARLDRWLSVLSHLAGWTGSGFAQDAADFLLAVVKERTDPRSLPGLEAMLPGSALTRLLHLPQLRTRADLTVVAGDIEAGKGLFSQIKLLALDWFYGADHDLVVNTGSMTGGIGRPAALSRYLVDRGAEVSHFNYFRNARSAGWLETGLLRGDESQGGFTPIAQAAAKDVAQPKSRGRARADAAQQPLAVFLPGIMGSALASPQGPVWLSEKALFEGRLAELAWGQAATVGEALEDFYGPLLRHLALTHRVQAFAYDWRQSVRTLAAQLAEHLLALLPQAEAQGQPVHLVAHSQGGLIVRAMAADGGRGAEVWRRIVALPGSRLLMLGTPNHGSYEAVRWLTGFNTTLRKISLVDFSHGTQGLIDIVRHYPGLLELLPQQAGADFFQRATWADLKRQVNGAWTPPETTALREAAATWELLRRSESDALLLAHTVYVAGCQPATVVGHTLAEPGDEFFLVTGRKQLEFDASHEGDGTVSWASGQLPGVPVFYVDATGHDELCAVDRSGRSFDAYVELLRTGRTALLPGTPPSRARGAGVPAVFTLHEPPFADEIPHGREIATFGLGSASPAPLPADDAPAHPGISVRVVHGNVAYANHAVLVGHYVGDGLVSGERVLDERLDHALNRHVDLGLYPGAPGTHAVFLNARPGRRPAGALVVGLGQVGTLTPSALQIGVRDVLLEYALVQRRRQARSDGGEPAGRLGLRVGSLLVGTGTGGIKVRESVDAILRGALDANDRLAAAEWDAGVFIDEIEFLEIYEDVAIAATEAVRALLDDATLEGRVHWPDAATRDGEGRQRRSRFEESPGWWSRLEIVEDRALRSLRFIATTDRARAEETLSTGEVSKAEVFVREACSSSSRNVEVTKTLFEMLLPLGLRQSAPDKRGTVLLLDEHSARFPWEMLEDRWSASGRPAAVACGMLRQFKTREFRERPMHTTDYSVLVVGHPDLQDSADFAPLPGAREEAVAVHQLFAGRGYAAMDCIDARMMDICNALHRRPWRVLHLAGHGVHEWLATRTATAPAGAATAAPRRVSGMVIGPDTVLTPGDVQQMRYVPELVFVNCCHLGATRSDFGDGNYARLAANLGAEFIRMGVKAVVAAGWAVDDAAAKRFALIFYQRMLAGETFGEAVRQAREATWTGFPGVNTWGAYQCYGDPAYRLVRDGDERTPRAVQPYALPSELVCDLRNLVENTRVLSREPVSSQEIVEQVRASLGAMRERVPPGRRDDWLALADVAAWTGFAWAEAGAYAEAVELLEHAVSQDRGECPLRALEQLANVRARLAVQQWLGAARDTTRRARTQNEAQQAAGALIAQSVRELDALVERMPSAERWTLLGSAYKRQAWTAATAAQRKAALASATRAYDAAWALEQERAGRQQRRANPYSFFNRATTAALLLQEPGRGKAAQAGTVASALALQSDCRRQLQAALEALDHDRPHLWLALAPADGQLALLLAGGVQDVTPEQIGDTYRQAIDVGASPREVGSVLEHLDFVLSQLPAAAAQLRAAIGCIRGRLA